MMFFSFFFFFKQTKLCVLVNILKVLWEQKFSAPAFHSGAISSLSFSVSHTVCPFLSSEWAAEVDAYLSTGRLNKQLFECYQVSGAEMVCTSSAQNQVSITTREHTLIHVQVYIYIYYITLLKQQKLHSPLHTV